MATQTKQEPSTVKLGARRPWFVFWRHRSALGLGDYSPLHKTQNHVVTLCGQPIHQDDGHGSATHVGIRATKRPPRHHALATCAKCQRKAAKIEGGK